MSKPKRARVKTDAIPAPATREEAEALLEEIGQLQREVQRIEADMNDRLAAIKREHEELAAPLNSEIEAAFHRLHIWAEANRADLLRGRAKTAKLATGEISWRKTPPRVSIRGQQAVIESLKRLGLGDLVRTREEVNKEAVLLDPARVEGIKGISITQREEFVARPFSSEVERAEVVKRKEAA